MARPPSSAEPVHLLVDSTGLKLSGAGEWLVEKHGTSRRRSWRKLHIGVDADTGRVVVRPYRMRPRGPEITASTRLIHATRSPYGAR